MVGTPCSRAAAARGGEIYGFQPIEEDYAGGHRTDVNWIGSQGRGVFAVINQGALTAGFDQDDRKGSGCTPADEAGSVDTLRLEFCQMKVAIVVLAEVTAEGRRQTEPGGGDGRICRWPAPKARKRCGDQLLIRTRMVVHGQCQIIHRLAHAEYRERFRRHRVEEKPDDEWWLLNRLAVKTEGYYPIDPVLFALNRLR